MRFLFEEGRMQHPVASRIPKPIWEYFFHGELFQDDQTLIEADASQLDTLFNGLALFTRSNSEKLRAWFAIAIGHPDLSDEVLMDFVRQLGFSHSACLEMLSSIGRASQVSVLVESSLDRKKLLETNDFFSMVFAAANGHLSVLQYLLDSYAPLLPHGDIVALVHNDYLLFREAASNGHLAILQHLVERVQREAPERLEAMLSAEDFNDKHFAFREAAGEGYQDVVSYLLQFPCVFAFAEMHDREYGARYIYPFVCEKLAAFRAMKAAYEAENPHGVFNFDDESSRFCFYLLRNMIRQNNEALQDDMLFLMGIPSVKALLHTAVTPGRENELLRLAYTETNLVAARLLLTMPLVREHAEVNDFYRAERAGGLDLSALARDAESSMTGLTEGEQRRLKSLTGHYQEQMNTLTVPHIMASLREDLTRLYTGNPAVVTLTSGEACNLPMAFDAFEALNLGSEDKREALKAYYQHTVHTAWRYLEKPNPWMSEHASYVYANDTRDERWSTFEEYQPLISLLYLAAKDEDIAAIDGFTIESRILHFIDELAHIGRAHNWDSTRPNVTSGDLEEYDDQDGDKPSCYSGVKRRLFQSLLGHPLLKLLTLEIIKAELRVFVREEFSQLLALKTRKEVEALQTHWETVCETGQGVEHLQEFNISSEKTIQFMAFLSQKYPLQFDEEVSFKMYIDARLKLDESMPHIAAFAGEIDLNGLFETYLRKKRRSNFHMFQDKAEASTDIDASAGEKGDEEEEVSSRKKKSRSD